MLHADRKTSARLTLLAALAVPLLGIAALAGGFGSGDDGQDPQEKVTPAAKPKAQASERIRYSRDVRPILSDRCFQCHGPDANKRQAGLRLDDHDEATRDLGGAFAIVPGSPDQSELVRRITSTNPDEVMPPENSHKHALSMDEQELLTRWIAEGAVYEPHWAFVPPVRPELPKTSDPGWQRSPIDAFVLARLDARGLRPSPEADRHTLLRRVFLDLTGLPPTPDELDAFEADPSPDAYERWVDRLLNEEPYRTRTAERLASPWLDEARYADTNGIHTDAGRQIWLYRDWVLNAFRANMPFDRFTTEQLAGDLLPDATVDQQIATGFNRCHVMTDEGGAIDAEYLVEYAVDRTSTLGSVFLGLTLGCARCHDHKFDPVSAQDFYNLYSFFNSNDEPGLYSQLPDPNRAFEPFIVVPTSEQKEELSQLAERIAKLQTELDREDPSDATHREEFEKTVSSVFAKAWAPSKPTTAKATDDATLTINDDGSVTASGTNPPKETYEITLRTDGTDLTALLLEALPDPALGGGIGRAYNKNAVVSGVTATAVSVVDPSKKTDVEFQWAWADHSQFNGDYHVTSLLQPGGSHVWALQGHEKPGGRVAILLAKVPFGFEGGTDLVVRVEQRSMYAEHTLARVRLGVAKIPADTYAMLPAAPSRWYVVGPFPGDKEQNRVYEPVYGPEEGDRLDFARNFGFGNQYWRFDVNLADDKLNTLADGRNVTYVGRYIYCPTPRTLDVSLGSDDGFKLYLNGVEVASRVIERGLAADQDKATLQLRAGANTVVMKICNTGGAAGFYYKPAPDSAKLAGDLVAAVLPESARHDELKSRFDRAWRVAYLPRYREALGGFEAANKRKAEVDAAAPRTMVMKELAKPRETFVLTRGVYDKPDPARPAHRAVPKALGTLPESAPGNRLGLAQWLLAPENPLTSRVAVNRLTELVFGTGLVRTSQDFGLQGEWPSHPELLDWLAIEFRESGWDLHHILRLLVTSATYRQSSVVRADVAEIDPDNRLLSYYPRRRLSAEQIRDQALYVSGLLVEKLGGPSVKPYQPDGLWQEVAMLQSNTREFQRGMAADLYRRSLYTYWKRASPPPTLMSFDAPTRESCVVRRVSTNTPLQALSLWNDTQFVEAARKLAERVLSEPGPWEEGTQQGSSVPPPAAPANAQPAGAPPATTFDDLHVDRLFRYATSRVPSAAEHAALLAALKDFRDRYAQSTEDAAKLLAIGDSKPSESLAKPELAAWTMVANAVLNLHETITQD
jgi:hypothetical protein